MNPDLPDITLTAHDDLPRDAAAVVDAGLDASNTAAAPLHAVQPLAVFARNGTGEVVGGAIGRTWGACCELQQLWVRPEQRLRGIGSTLVRTFERRAADRGCDKVYLDTFSFQAAGFYLALGYQVRLEVNGYSPDITRYTMIRGLSDEPEGAAP